MTHSPLTNAIYLSRQCSPRNGTAIDTLLVHHQASTNAAYTRDLMVSGQKEVSANYIITNEGLIWLIVDEDMRAWTSGSSSDGGKGAAWDRRSITVEVENESGSPDWRISDAAMRALAALLQDLRSRYAIRNVFGHRDLWTRFQASYPTYCPGPETVNRLLQLAGGGSITLPPAEAPSGSSTAPSGAIDYGFGLTSSAQLAVQKALARLGRYSGDQDGAFGRLSVRAFQKYLVDKGYLAAAYSVDGIPGKVYGYGVQLLAKAYGYDGPMDGLPGDDTSAAISRWAASVAPSVPQVTGLPAGRDWSYWEPSGALAARVQRALRVRGRYPGKVDGVFGPLTRKGVQLTLAVGGFPGGMTNPDGVIEREGCLGIQQYAKKFGSYAGPLDRAPREASWTGFALGLERP